MTGLSRYVLGEGKGAGNDNLPPGEDSRVAWIGGQSFGIAIDNRSDAELAVRIMEFDALNQASRTKRCEKDAVHLMLAWRIGEEPTREQMEEAARGALRAIGMENAKAVWAAHRDEEHAHLHIVASKINPDTGRAYDLKSNFLKLSKWAQAYEREHGGIVCLRRQDANRLRDAIERREPGAVLAAMTEQRPTFTGADLERALAKQMKGEFLRAQFAEAVLTHSDAVKLSDHAAGPTTRYSTRTVVEAEQYVLRAAAGLARDDRHGLPYHALAGVADRLREEGKGLGEDQLAALNHATRPGGIALIDGQAGSGKSHTMAAIRAAYEDERYEVIGLAPTNVVAQDMKADGFVRAGTVHSELFALGNDRRKWTDKTVVMVDEAAMVDTKTMAVLATYAQDAGAKLILIGDDRQLSSIERGGMFGVLKDRYGAEALTELRRQHKDEDRRAASMLAEGNFAEGLAIHDAKGDIHWTRTQPEARAALVEQWAKDSAAGPEKSRFVFAYTNADVTQLNADIRAVRRERGELGKQDYEFETAHGKAAFAAGDRIQFIGTDKKKGLYNGAAGTVQAIDGATITVRLDGKQREGVAFNAAEFDKFRHGYAGTIYKGQGRTLDQTYLYHSEHWRSAASYVALTRHRDKAELFVATNTARDTAQLARQMARVDDRRAASQFHQQQEQGPIRPFNPKELQAHLAGRPMAQERPAAPKQERPQESKLRPASAKQPEPVSKATPHSPTPGAVARPAARAGKGALKGVGKLLDVLDSLVTGLFVSTPPLTPEQQREQAQEDVEAKHERADQDTAAKKESEMERFTRDFQSKQTAEREERDRDDDRSRERRRSR